MCAPTPGIPVLKARFVRPSFCAPAQVLDQFFLYAFKGTCALQVYNPAIPEDGYFKPLCIQYVAVEQGLGRSGVQCVRVVRAACVNMCLGVYACAECVPMC